MVRAITKENNYTTKIWRWQNFLIITCKLTCLSFCNNESFHFFSFLFSSWSNTWYNYHVQYSGSVPSIRSTRRRRFVLKQAVCSKHICGLRFTTAICRALATLSWALSGAFVYTFVLVTTTCSILLYYYYEGDSMKLKKKMHFTEYYRSTFLPNIENSNNLNGRLIYLHTPLLRF